MSEDLKKLAAQAAIDYVKENQIVGVGTGSTVDYFIEALAHIKHRIEGTVTTSVRSEEKLKSLNIPVFNLNSVDQVSVYIDGADEINEHFQMIKGAGGAHTREKILATVAKQFVCITHDTKKVDLLGHHFPVPVEVIPMARSFVGREMLKLGGHPVYRENFITDNGNIILDVYDLDLKQPREMENKINSLPGVVDNGIFANRTADVLLLGTTSGCLKYLRHQDHPIA